MHKTSHDCVTRGSRKLNCVFPPKNFTQSLEPSTWYLYVYFKPFCLTVTEMSRSITILMKYFTGAFLYALLLKAKIVQNAIFTAYDQIENQTIYNSHNNQHIHSFKSDNSTKLICFYTFTNQFKPNILDGLCTHINVGFFSINEQNFTLNSNPELLQQLNNTIMLKKNNKNLKVLITVGGAGDESFSLMTKNHTTRKLFIRSAMQLIKEFKIDGIDIDWEWPAMNGDDKEKVRFVQLLHELRVEFDRHKKKYILSVDVPALQPIIEMGFYVQHIAEHVDFVNVMCYDYRFYTNYFPLTGHNAPLYHSSSNLLVYANTNYSIHFWISNMMPREKIVLGLPTYGHSFKLSFSDKHDLNAPANGFGTIGINGFVSYMDIYEFIQQNNTTVIYDNVSKVPYAYQFPNWVSFDNEVSLSIKASYVLEENLSGVMVFSVNTDDYLGNCSKDGQPFPLIRQVRSILFNEV